MKFTRPKKIRFHEADPAGVLFFSRIYEMTHAHYEDWLADMGFGWQAWFKNPDWAVPLKKTEAEFYRPIFPGETYELSLSLVNLGISSFTLRTKFSSSEGVHAICTTVHVFMDTKAYTKLKIPSSIREKFEKVLNS